MEKLSAASSRIQHLYSFLAVVGIYACLVSIQDIKRSRHERHTSRQRAISEHEDRKLRDLELQSRVFMADPVQKDRLCNALDDYKASRRAELSAALRGKLHEITTEARGQQRDHWMVFAVGLAMLIPGSLFWYFKVQLPTDRILRALARREQRELAKATCRKSRRRKSCVKRNKVASEPVESPGVAA